MEGTGINKVGKEINKVTGKHRSGRRELCAERILV
jgi:hypothetical protein